MNPIKYITYLWINLSMQFFFLLPVFLSLSLTHIQHILRQHTSSAQTTHRSTVSTIFLNLTVNTFYSTSHNARRPTFRYPCTGITSKQTKEGQGFYSEKERSVRLSPSLSLFFSFERTFSRRHRPTLIITQWPQELKHDWISESTCNHSQGSEGS